jgi:hypothetical protein
MHKTTVYLPDDLKAALERTSAATRRSEAEIIREGIRLVTQREASPKPKLPLFASGDPELSLHVDEALAGFGER